MTKHRILIADDNRDAAETFAQLLSLDGHDVRCAADGRDALRVFEEFQPDVVLLDLSMPLIDGCEVARRIRESDTRGVLLLALTGWARDEDIARSQASGFDHHLTKPVEFQSIAELL